jgi:hypothetical protein
MMFDTTGESDHPPTSRLYSTAEYHGILQIRPRTQEQHAGRCIEFFPLGTKGHFAGGAGEKEADGHTPACRALPGQSRNLTESRTGQPSCQRQRCSTGSDQPPSSNPAPLPVHRRQPLWFRSSPPLHPCSHCGTMLKHCTAICRAAPVPMGNDDCRSIQSGWIARRYQTTWNHPRLPFTKGGWDPLVRAKRGKRGAHLVIESNLFGVCQHVIHRYLAVPAGNKKQVVVRREDHGRDAIAGRLRQLGLPAAHFAASANENQRVGPLLSKFCFGKSSFLL